MKKKHKKHHKSEKKSHEEEQPEKEGGGLRLVLKVGDTVSDVYSPHQESSSKKHKHKKKKKKKSSDREKRKHHDSESKSHSKRRREESEDENVSQEDEEEEPVAKKAMIEEPERVMRVEERVIKRQKSSEEHGVLRICLKHLQKMLQKKDVNGFFAYPVNDMIAPGYSNIILAPMDFSTMLTKIENNRYRNVVEYKKDFVLMCNNAMTYNRPETIYYKEAKRLLHIGLKQMSKDKLINMKRTLPFLASLTYEELGVEEPDETKALMEAMVEEERKEKERAKEREEIGRFEAVPDNMSPEEILAQAQAAAKDAADILTLRQPKSRFAFLRRRDDGSTSMTVLNPDNDGIVSETEKVVSLGSLVGKLTSGTGSISGFKEDKRNRVTPVMYLNYGPFSTYGPQYDSTFSNMTKEESDLLLSTYGDETGVQYSKSVLSFVENAGDYAVSMVDHLLDILTKGEHTKTQKLLSQKRESTDGSDDSQNLQQTGDQQPITDQSQQQLDIKPQNIDINSLKSLSDLGVDVSFLDDFEKTEKKDPVQEKLDQTASLINDLQQTQMERLSNRLPQHLADVPGPSEKEIQLAQKVTKELKELTKEVVPGDITSVQSLRSAMGISFNPTVPSSTANQDTTQSVPAIVPAQDGISQGDSNQNNTGTVMSNPIIIGDQTANQNAENSDITNQSVINDDDDDDMETDISEFLQFPSQT